MDYQYIQKTIEHLQQAIDSLSELTPQSHDITGIAVADEV
jgi:prefoldin subunit 5